MGLRGEMYDWLCTNTYLHWQPCSSHLWLTFDCMCAALCTYALCVIWPSGLVKYTYQQLGLCLSTGATYFAHFWTTTLTVESIGSFNFFSFGILTKLSLTHKPYTKGEKVMSWRFDDWGNSKATHTTEGNSFKIHKLCKLSWTLWMFSNQFLWLSKFIWKWPTTPNTPTTTIIIIIISAYLMLR